MNFLDHLNPAQRAAVEHTQGPMLVIAGAGSGKTRVITYKVAYLIEKKLFPAENILAVTFTNKAAEEMKERIYALLHQKETRHLPLICTFHSFCARFLRKEIGVLGYPAHYTIYDVDDQKRLLKNISNQLKIDSKEFPSDYLKYRISQAKIREIQPGKYLNKYDYHGAENVSRVYTLYEQNMTRSGALDFDDLLLKTNQILQKYPEIRKKLNRKYRYILVDEFQDTNPPQYRLVNHLTSNHQNICVVGDEDQSIYGFRGAILTNILHLDNDFPDCRTFKLEQNYRSTRVILRAASVLAAQNTKRREKKLWTENEEGSPIGFFEAYDPTEEAWWVARNIQSILLEDFDAQVGVLYRTNFQSRRLEDALRSLSIRYRLVGGLSFYNRKEIKDMSAYLKLILNKKDDISFRRAINTPPRGIGEKTVHYLINRAAMQGISLWEALDHELGSSNLTPRALSALAHFRELILNMDKIAGAKKLGELVHQIYQQSGYQDFLQTQKDPHWETREENIREFITFAGEHERGGGALSTFLDHIALYSTDDEETGNERVSLMTLHSAKGLEFDVVFMVGLEEGLIPHYRSMESEDDLEEERRLCYVGMTRSKKKLALSRVKIRRRLSDGANETVKPSRFLMEIPEDCLQSCGAQDHITIQAVDSRKKKGVKLRDKGFTTLDTAEDVRSFFRKEPGSQTGPTKLSRPRIVTRPAGSVSIERQPERSPTAMPQRSGSPSASKQTRSNPQNLKSGDRVAHPTFGTGTIVRVEKSSKGRKLKILFDARGMKNILQHLANLEKIPRRG